MSSRTKDICAKTHTDLVRGACQRNKSQLKELPMAEAGIIWATNIIVLNYYSKCQNNLQVWNDINNDCTNKKIQEQRQASHLEDFQIIYLEFTLKEMGHNFPPLKCELYIVHPPKEYHMQGWKK